MSNVVFHDYSHRILSGIAGALIAGKIHQFEDDMEWYRNKAGYNWTIHTVVPDYRKSFFQLAAEHQPSYFEKLLEKENKTLISNRIIFTDDNITFS